MNEKARSARSVAPPLLLGTAAACCLSSAGLAVIADPVATSIARDRLAEQGVLCDARFAVELPWTLDAARIEPTSCTVREGAVASFELLDAVTIELGQGLEARLVTGGRARVVLRVESPGIHASGGGAVLEALAIPERVGMLVAGAAQLSSRDLPQIELASIEIVRGDRTSAVLTGVHVLGRTASTPLTMRVERAELPPIAGPLGTRASIAIAPLSAEATPEHATLEGDLVIDAALPILGAIQRASHVTVVGDGLDGPSPTYDVRF